MPDTVIAGTPAELRDADRGNEARGSAVAWSAILAGAFAAAALSLVLFALASGFGLAAISPWPGMGASITSFTIVAGIWLIVTQWLSSGLGGYLTGRLRTKCVGVHTHEVFFRDTANGFVTWAVASVAGAVFLAAAGSSVVGGTVRSVAQVAGGAVQGAAQQPGQTGNNLATGYFVDALFRSDHPGNTAAIADARGQSTRILLNGLRNGAVSPPDRAWLVRLVADNTGLSQADAQKRVDGVIAEESSAEARLRKAADDARRAGAYVSIFTGLSMVIGAFIACVAAALGGAYRDAY